MSPELLNSYQFSYVSEYGMLLLADKPTLPAIAQIRDMLDNMTDALIQEHLNETTPIPD